MSQNTVRKRSNAGRQGEKRLTFARSVLVEWPEDEEDKILHLFDESQKSVRIDHVVTDRHAYLPLSGVLVSAVLDPELST